MDELKELRELVLKLSIENHKLKKEVANKQDSLLFWYKKVDTLEEEIKQLNK